MHATKISTRTTHVPLKGLCGSMLRALSGSVARASLVAAFAMIALPASVQAQTSAGQPATKTESKATQSTQDVLIFRNGKSLSGTIVSMTEKVVKFRSTVNGIPFETEYQRDEISEIKRGVAAPAPVGEKTADGKPAMTLQTAGATPGGNVPAIAPTIAPTTAPAEIAADDGRKRVYWIDLEGKFGEDITETPLRSAIEDARKNKADVIFVYVNGDWSTTRYGEKVDVSGLQEDFEEMRRAEKIMPVLTDEIAAEWDHQPKFIFWIRRAMGGCAFFPLISNDNYFTSDGKLGGIGNLSTMMKGRGHERVVAKQVSLRLQHAVGWARKGGYNESLVRALTMPEFVLTVKLVDGKPVFFERYPESPDEELLTDDGDKTNQDTIDLLARGEGNDVLTMNARIAKLINFSQGTVDTRDELFAATGLDREGVLVEGKSKRIMKDWSDGLVRAQKQLRKLVEELQEIQVTGDRQQRIRARGSRINKIEQIKSVLKRYLEAWDPYFLNEVGIPLNGEGDANIEALTGQQESLKLQNLGDK
jgi:hypothetical protein